MIRWGSILLLLLLPRLGLAQTIPIQTGEHADFTRVVLTIPVGTDWQLGRNDSGYVLRVALADRFDLSRFFDLIPRRRILDALQSADRAELQMRVTCPCFAEAFLFRPNLLVIDIRDGAPPTDARFEQMLDPQKASDDGMASLVQRNQPPTYVVPQDRLLPLLTPPPRVIEPIPEKAEQASDAVVGRQLPQIEESMDMEELEKSITQSLGIGLSDGTLQGELRQRSSTSEMEDSDLTADIIAALDLPGVYARTGADPLAVASANSSAVTQEGRSCLPDSYFDISAWGIDQPFVAQFYPLRARLLDVVEDIDEEAVLQLARLYVYFGFGREARQVLSLDPQQSQELLYLDAIASIIDDDPTDPTLFEGQVSCASPVALWATMAGQADPFDAKVESAAVLRALKTLPSGLQTVIGPRLSERFLAIGELDAAAQALATSKGGDAVSVETKLADAALSHALGDVPQSMETLSDVARNDHRVTPEAMVRFFSDGLEQNIVFSDDDFFVADALRFENAQGQEIVALVKAQVRAYVGTDRFEEAIKLMESDGARINEDDLVVLENHLARQATERMPDIDFLRLIWSERLKIREADTQNAAAVRLLSLGFPNRIPKVLSAPVQGDAAVERNFLLAQSEMALSQPEVAIRLLDGDQSERARLLRDEARTLIAFGFSMISPRQGEQDQSLPSAGIPTQIALDTDDPQLREVSDAVLAIEPRQLDPQAPLADGRALLERSAESRAILDGLLLRFESPVDF